MAIYKYNFLFKVNNSYVCHEAKKTTVYFLMWRKLKEVNDEKLHIQHPMEMNMMEKPEHPWKSDFKDKRKMLIFFK